MCQGSEGRSVSEHQELQEVWRTGQRAGQGLKAGDEGVVGFEETDDQTY